MALLDASFIEEYKKAEAASGFECLPPGKYTLQVTETGVKETKDGFGLMVNVTFSVVGPKYQGRKIFERFNIRNRSAQAQRIGVGQLKNLVVSAGILEPLTDTDMLLGRVVSGDVVIEKDKTGLYGDKNKVRRFEAAAPAPAAFNAASAPAFGATSAQAAPAFGAAPAQAPAPSVPEGGSFAAAFAVPAQAAPGGFKF